MQIDLFRQVALIMSNVMFVLVVIATIVWIVLGIRLFVKVIVEYFSERSNNKNRQSGKVPDDGK